MLSLVDEVAVRNEQVEARTVGQYSLFIDGIEREAENRSLRSKKTVDIAFVVKGTPKVTFRSVTSYASVAKIAKSALEECRKNVTIQQRP